jgi:hypothetical protein
MCIDITSDWMFAFGNSAGWGFDAADALWTNIQNKMTTFINNNGGNATVQSPVLARTGIL